VNMAVSYFFCSRSLAALPLEPHPISFMLYWREPDLAGVLLTRSGEPPTYLVLHHARVPRSPSSPSLAITILAQPAELAVFFHARSVQGACDGASRHVEYPNRPVQIHAAGFPM
jgi:hypothetical protein